MDYGYGYNCSDDPGSGANGRPDESKPPSVVEEFLQYKTKYVGDATAVGSIIYLLDYPEGIDYDHFELHTVSPSYGVTVYLQTDTEIGDYYTAKEAAGKHPLPGMPLSCFP